jgi:uncharacterized YccA/Bax inhibitor family protein
MRSSNPVLNDKVFVRNGASAAVLNGTEMVPGGYTVPDSPAGLTLPGAARPTTMTVEGTVYKSALLLALVVAAAAVSWGFAADGTILLPGVGVAFFALLGLGIATAVRPQWAIVTGPLYALASGVLLGAISALYNATYEGIVTQAVIATMATAGGMLLAYSTGLIRATPRFRKIIVSATLGIMLLYVVSIVMRLFGAEVPFLHDSGPIGIAVSLFIVAVAAFNLVLDFDFIERGAAAGADRRMEWYGAFGVMVTLVWLYLEMLRLLSKLRD